VHQKINTKTCSQVQRISKSICGRIPSAQRNGKNRNTILITYTTDSNAPDYTITFFLIQYLQLVVLNLQ
jgi:hypothetical protein